MYDDDKEVKKDALKKLMGMMKSQVGKKLGGMKGKIPEEHRMEGPDEDGMLELEEKDTMSEGSEGLSEKEKMMISKLYHKYCK